MADDVTFQSSTLATPPSGEIIAADDILGVKYQRVKLSVGDDGSAQDAKSINGKPRVSAMDYLYDIAEGNVPGHYALNKFGHNHAVAASEEPIWTQSQAYTYMTVASTLYISSDDAGDTQDYEVQGLDENWEIQVVNVTANGLNFVALTGSWLRVFRVKNIGTTDNAGNIYISDDNTDAGGDGIPDNVASIKARIDIGINQTLMALWTVPANCDFYMVQYYASTSLAKATEVYLRVRPFGQVFQVKKLITINQGTETIPYPLPLKVTEKSDIAISAIATGGGGEVSAGFDGWWEE